jgi:hypothetical protein
MLTLFNNHNSKGSSYLFTRLKILFYKNFSNAVKLLELKIGLQGRLHRCG